MAEDTKGSFEQGLSYTKMDSSRKIVGAFQLIPRKTHCLLMYNKRQIMKRDLKIPKVTFRTREGDEVETDGGYRS